MHHMSRRNLLHTGCAAGAATSISWMRGEAAAAETAEAPFYRDDWFGDPWRKPEAALLIHGNDESSIVWYAWMPRMAREFRVIRPDLPGFGRSKIPDGFEWSLKALATFIARVLDQAGVQSAHIVGAKTGGAIAMQFAADYPERVLTLSVASGPASVIQIANPSPIPQRDRLGTHVSKEMVEYWNAMFGSAPEQGTNGLHTALAKFDLARDGVLQRIKAPALIITADKSALQSVEKVRAYQQLIPNSRLVVLESDAYHIAAANPDECISNILAFIEQTTRKA